MITGATRVAGVVGWPVEHSRSPAIHNAAFAASGLDWVYVALPVPPGAGADAVRALPHLGIAGVNVTMPHKSAAASACDERTPVADRLGSVNTVAVRDDGTLLGDSTDGEGFLRSLTDVGLDPAGRDVVVLGTGGAARAVTDALVEAGASVGVAGRRREAVDAVVAAVPGAHAAPWPGGGPVDAAVVVNATPIGMGADAGLPCRPRAGQWCVDLVYHPVTTAWMEAAGSAGARPVGGLGMLVHQAALAFECWTGVAAPLDAMRAAAGATG